MQERETKWTPMKALGRAQREVDALGLPLFHVDLSERRELNFSKLTNYENKELEDFLTMYGGYKGYLETKDKKKPTREELRGEIMTKFEALRELRRDLIEQQALLKKSTGLLNTYTTAYNTVSRVVALRTYGHQG